MANLILAFPNRGATAALSGGSWLSSLPLANLQSRLISKVARSADLAVASTQFTIDQAADFPVKLLALVACNLSLNALYRLRASNDSGFSVLTYDSGWLSAWPVMFTDDTTEYEDDGPWWTGRPATADLAGLPFSIIHVLPTVQTARYWKLEIDDTGNPDGYVEAGYLFLAPGWQVGVNMAYGNTLGWVDPSGVQTTRGGADWVDARPKYRVMRFSIPLLPQGEGFQKALEMMRRQGIGEPVFVIPDPDDTTNMIYRAFVARLRVLGELGNPSVRRASMSFELKELVA